METWEKSSRKTLAEIRASLAAKPQTPDDKAPGQVTQAAFLSGSVGTGSGLGGSVSRAHENGVRVSGNTNGAEDGGVFADAKGTGGSCSSLNIREKEKDAVVEHRGGSEKVKGLGTVLGVNKNGEKGVVKTMSGGNTSGLIGNGSGAKKGSRAKIEGPTSKIELKEGRNLRKKRGYEDNGSSLPENGEDQDERNDGEEEDMGDEGYEYSVGDFVWGKIKSHPWWPGQIYDPSNASENAAKYSQRDRFLVAYFGDGTFAWCYPSQLKPFEENFEEMSKQTNSKSFVKAVEGALDEFGRLIELEMTCSCVPKENQIGLARPLAVNAGIREGVFVPEGGIGKHSISKFGPAKFLADLRYIAQVVSMSSMLELNVLKHQLLAFYRAKGVYQLPMYTKPQYIVGLEDKIRIGECDGRVDVPIQGPFEEDWLSSPVSPGLNKINQNFLQKSSLISEDKLYQRRKQKSIAEIMSGEMDVDPKNNEENMAKEGAHSGKLASMSKRKKKGSDEAENHGGDNVSSQLGRRKRAKFSGAPMTTENEVPSVENAGGRRNRETNRGPVSREKKKKESSSVEDDGGGVKEETENGFRSRERKKSKYLSPPYTSLNRGERNSSSMRESKLEFLKVSSVARIGERMSRAAGQVIGSPPILKCSGETHQKNASRELGSGLYTSGISSPATPKQEQNTIIDPMVTKASAKAVLSEIRSVVVNPTYEGEAKSLDMITGFFSAFRSSVFRNGSNYKIYNKRRSGRKPNSLDSEFGSSGKDPNRTDHNLVERKFRQRRSAKNESESVEHKPRQMRSEKNEVKSVRSEKNDAKLDEHKPRRMRSEKNETKSAVPKLKQAAGASDLKTNDKKTERKASSAALFLTFGPGVPLPSKDDLIATYSRFGSLNESDTQVLYNSCCAQVVFVKSSDAEQAFNHSMKTNSSGDGKVSYRLMYLSGTSRIRELDEKLHPKASSLPKESGKTPENLPLQFIRQKLESMTAMVVKSDGNMSQEMKINLEREMKGLLEKVSTMP